MRAPLWGRHRGIAGEGGTGEGGTGEGGRWGGSGWQCPTHAFASSVHPVPHARLRTCSIRMRDPEHSP
eukprot:354907-Chlamydomonas_euryale.AAC.1